MKLTKTIMLMVFAILISCSDKNSTEPDDVPANYALLFDGDDDYVEIPDSPELSAIGSTFTLEFWIKIDAWPSYTQEVMGKWGPGWTEDDEYCVLIESSGRIILKISGNSGQNIYEAVTSKSHLELKTWTHIAAVFDASKSSFTLYFNGNYDNSVNTNNLLLDRNTAQPLILGTFEAMYSNFKGYLDEIRIWNIAKTQDAIQAYMTSHLYGYEKGLVGYWPFNEGTNNILNDFSKYKNHGTLHGGISWVQSRYKNLTEPKNRMPWIENLQAIPSTIKTGEITYLSCVATDEDGDDLIFCWTASKGSFPSGTSGTIVQWQAPDHAGIYAISLIVGDGKKNAKDSVSVLVYETGTVTDIDGNVYKTVKLGNQWWMAENLKVTRYRNGDSILNAKYDIQWILSKGAYCAYNNDIGNVATYGLLYDRYVVNDSRKIAPVGWHVPTDKEWQTLVDLLGGSSVAGGKMKTIGTIQDGTGLWNQPNTGSTNESGFSGLPGGYLSYDYRTNTHIFCSLGIHGRWWSSDGPARVLRFGSSDVGRYGGHVAFSVRCVRD